MEVINDIDYFDNIYCLMGGSTDDTFEKHKHIEKTIFLETPEWDSNNINIKDIAKQYTSVFNYIKDKNKKEILLILSADIIFSNDFIEELEVKLSNLVKNKKRNVLPLPYSKVLSRTIAEERTRIKTNTFFIYSAIKFNEDIKWDSIKNENSILGNTKMNIMTDKWKTKMDCYEAWFFTKEDFEKKALKHAEWKNVRNKGYKEIVKSKILGKLKKYKKMDIDPDKHPDKVKELIEILTEEHFGYDMFGLVK